MVREQQKKSRQIKQCTLQVPLAHLTTYIIQHEHTKFTMPTSQGGELI